MLIFSPVLVNRRKFLRVASEDIQCRLEENEKVVKESDRKVKEPRN